MTEKILSQTEGWWCTKCNSLCTVYEQGLRCSCGDPWEEHFDWEPYPKDWIKVTVMVKTETTDDR